MRGGPASRAPALHLLQAAGGDPRGRAAGCRIPHRRDLEGLRAGGLRPLQPDGIQGKDRALLRDADERRDQEPHGEPGSRVRDRRGSTGAGDARPPRGRAHEGARGGDLDRGGRPDLGVEIRGDHFEPRSRPQPGSRGCAGDHRGIDEISASWASRWRRC